MQTKKQGFTLIELLVVIVIIGILATIAIPQFTGYFKKARDSERKAAVNNISTIIKVNAVSATGTVDYALANKVALDTILDGQGYAEPGATQGHTYLYAASADDFVVAVCSEEDGAVIYSAGTQNGMNAVSCDPADPAVDLASAAAPFNYTTDFTW